MGMDASLIKAMGGPSSGKAGVTRDPEETNRIIAEASKNSKYFQEVRRRDEQLTERINRLLKERDEIMKVADLAKAEAHADQVIADLESTRDLSKIIVHVDLDAFFASVEALDNPSLIGKPFGVGGGVLSTASYEARKYGVRSGMATFIARKLCPDLIVVKSHYNRYSEMSKIVMDVLKTYDPDMCIMGADEAYLTLNDYCDTHQVEPEECVQKMRAEVHAASKLTISAGIATTRMLAKICSDRNKPNGQFELKREASAIIAFMHDLPIRKIPGIGRVSERVLTEMGVRTCGDVYTHRGMISVMDRQLGLRGLLEAYLGLGSNVVEPPVREGRKSIGVESTFHAISDKAKLFEKLEHIATELEEDCTRSGWAGKTLTLKYKLDTHQTFTRAKALTRYITKKEDILATGRELLLKELPLSLRLIGLRLTSLKDLRPPPNGIEKFFNNASDTSSNKKRKRTEPSQEYVIDESLLYLDAEADDNAEDDRAEWDQQEPVDARDIPMMPNRWAESGEAGPSCPPPPPRSPPKKQHSTDGSGAGSEIKKPNSTGKSSSAVTGERERESHICPICSKELMVDNAGLNAHVDYCLSKGTIMQAATATASSGPSRSRSSKSTTTPRTKRPTLTTARKKGPKPTTTAAEEAEDSDPDGRGKPKKKKPFSLSQSGFGKAGFTRTRRAG